MTNTYLATPQSNEPSVDYVPPPKPSVEDRARDIRNTLRNTLAQSIAFDLECQANWQRIQDDITFD